MPDPSYYPLIAALGLPTMGWGVLASGAAQIVMLGLGALILISGCFGWALEPSAE
jgi:hypothetical protein